ncbi:MAG: metalloregulator ArsR/SmtB family transcription factor [Lachnospiraceae bacterium]|nr:metalloregulator ArsR/SmtB family transcription factor [Lachnospiraceae bacterium]MDE6251269.1 metalloregulator ArsR/SmtB family transcription factor [Lachnospiraceae bacterium]
MHTGSLEFLAEGLEGNDLYILTEFFKMLGNPTRIHILLLLMEQDSCVSNLAERLGMTQSAVSHQLSLLKTNKLVRRHRDGKMIFYTLTDDHVRMVIKKGMEHILER